MVLVLVEKSQHLDKEREQRLLRYMALQELHLIHGSDVNKRYSRNKHSSIPDRFINRLERLPGEAHV